MNANTELHLREDKRRQMKVRRRTKPMTIYLMMRHQQDSATDHQECPLFMNAVTGRALVDWIIERVWRRVEQASRHQQREKVAQQILQYIDLTVFHREVVGDTRMVQLCPEQQPSPHNSEEITNTVIFSKEPSLLTYCSISKSKSHSEFKPNKYVATQQHPSSTSTHQSKLVELRNQKKLLIMLPSELIEDSKLASDYRRARQLRDKQLQCRKEQQVKIEYIKKNQVRRRLVSFAFGYNGEQLKLKHDKKHIKLHEEEELMRTRVQTTGFKTKQRSQVDVVPFKRRYCPSDQNIGAFLQRNSQIKGAFDTAIAMAFRERITSEAYGLQQPTSQRSLLKTTCSHDFYGSLRS